jgi:hypothetical protein
MKSLQNEKKKEYDWIERCILYNQSAITNASKPDEDPECN